MASWVSKQRSLGWEMSEKSWLADVRGLSRLMSNPVFEKTGEIQDLDLEKDDSKLPRH